MTLRKDPRSSVLIELSRVVRHDEIEKTALELSESRYAKLVDWLSTGYIMRLAHLRFLREASDNTPFPDWLRLQGISDQEWRAETWERP